MSQIHHTQCETYFAPREPHWNKAPNIPQALLLLFLKSNEKHGKARLGCFSVILPSIIGFCFCCSDASWNHLFLFEISPLHCITTICRFSDIASEICQLRWDSEWQLLIEWILVRDYSMLIWEIVAGISTRNWTGGTLNSNKWELHKIAQKQPDLSLERLVIDWWLLSSLAGNLPPLWQICTFGRVAAIWHNIQRTITAHNVQHTMYSINNFTHSGGVADFSQIAPTGKHDVP